MSINNHRRSPTAIPTPGKRPGDHVWVPGSDVQSLWKKFGWSPPSEAKRAMPPAFHATTGKLNDPKVLRG